MSEGLATAFALALYALAAIPVVLMWWWPRASAWLGVGFFTAVFGVAFIQTGLLQRSRLTSTDVTGLVSVAPEISRCTHVMEMLAEAAVVLEAPSAKGIVVDGRNWDRLPQQAQDGILACAREMVSSDTGTQGVQDIKVIRR